MAGVKDVPLGMVVEGRKVRPVCEYKGHKLASRLNGYLEFEIYCKRFRCDYLEINPTGMQAESLRLKAKHAELKEQVKTLEEVLDDHGLTPPA